jgi:hypothetical protein
MRHHSPMSSACLIALALVIVATVVRPPIAQQGGPLPPPPKPYGAVPLTLPRPLADAGLEAFRKELAAIVKRRSKTDLIKLVVPQVSSGRAISADRSRRQSPQPTISSERFTSIMRAAIRGTGSRP